MNSQVIDEEQNPDREIKDDNKEIERICLSRKCLVANSSNINFDKAVKGCLVRITLQSTGDHKDYKIGEIVGVIEKPLYYKVENKDINKYLLVKIGKEIKEFKILFISSKPTQGLELSYYLRELTNSGIPRPTLRQIREK